MGNPDHAQPSYIYELNIPPDLDNPQCLDLLKISIAFLANKTLLSTLIDTCMLFQWNLHTGVPKRGSLLLGGMLGSLLLWHSTFPT